MPELFTGQINDSTALAAVCTKFVQDHDLLPDLPAEPGGQAFYFINCNVHYCVDEIQRIALRKLARKR